MDYALEGRCSIPDRSKGSGDPVSFPMGAGSFIQGVKRQEREADHSTAFSAGFKDGGAIPKLPNMSSWRGCNFTFTYHGPSTQSYKQECSCIFGSIGLTLP
jgi:hypothetical protein